MSGAPIFFAAKDDQATTYSVTVVAPDSVLVTASTAHAVAQMHLPVVIGWWLSYQLRSALEMASAARATQEAREEAARAKARAEIEADLSRVTRENDL